MGTGKTAPCNIYPGDYQKHRGDAARGRLLLLTPNRGAPAELPFPTVPGSLSSVPWQALGAVGSPDQFIHPVYLGSLLAPPPMGQTPR